MVTPHQIYNINGVNVLPFTRPANQPFYMLLQVNPVFPIFNIPNTGFVNYQNYTTLLSAFNTTTIPLSRGENHDNNDVFSIWNNASIQNTKERKNNQNENDRNHPNTEEGNKSLNENDRSQQKETNKPQEKKRKIGQTQSEKENNQVDFRQISKKKSSDKGKKKSKYGETRGSSMKFSKIYTSSLSENKTTQPKKLVKPTDRAAKLLNSSLKTNKTFIRNQKKEMKKQTPKKAISGICNPTYKYDPRAYAIHPAKPTTIKNTTHLNYLMQKNMLVNEKQHKLALKRQNSDPTHESQRKQQKVALKRQNSDPTHESQRKQQKVALKRQNSDPLQEPHEKRIKLDSTTNLSVANKRVRFANPISTSRY